MGVANNLLKGHREYIARKAPEIQARLEAHLIQLTAYLRQSKSGHPYSVKDLLTYRFTVSSVPLPLLHPLAALRRPKASRCSSRSPRRNGSRAHPLLSPTPSTQKTHFNTELELAATLQRIANTLTADDAEAPIVMCLHRSMHGVYRGKDAGDWVETTFDAWKKDYKNLKARIRKLSPDGGGGAGATVGGDYGASGSGYGDCTQASTAAAGSGVGQRDTAAVAGGGAGASDAAAAAGGGAGHRGADARPPAKRQLSRTEREKERELQKAAKNMKHMGHYFQ